MKSLTHTIKICSVIACFWTMAAVQTRSAVAQDANPFDNKTSVENQDPFGRGTGDVNEDPFGDAQNSKKNQLSPSQIRNEQEEIRVKNKKLQLQIAILDQENTALKRKIDFCETKEKSTSESYRSVIEKMLASENADVQLFALKAIQKTISQGRQPSLGPKLSEPGIQRLVQLTESESSEIKKLALQWLLENESTEAANLGYQRPGPWHAIGLSPKTLEIRRALREPSFFDHEETELHEILEQIQDSYSINVIPENGVDEKLPVTYRSSGLKLGNTLKGLLSKYDLEFQVYDEKLAIVPKGHPEPKISLIYQVKGLVDGNLAIDKMTRIIDEMTTEQKLDCKISVIDEHRMAVSAAESVQAKVAEFLGQLATYH